MVTTAAAGEAVKSERRGAELARDDAAALTASRAQLSPTTDWPGQGSGDRGLTIKDTPPPAERRPEALPPRSDVEALRDAAQALAKRARDSFRDACESDGDLAETSYLASKDCVEELWKYAKYRDVPFRDLLGALSAALKYRNLSEFTEVQRDVLRSAFSELPVWMLEYDVVDEILDKFAEHDIDITGPLRPTSSKRLKITIEEVD